MKNILKWIYKYMHMQYSGFQNYHVDHTLGIYAQSAGGLPFTAVRFQSKGDPIADLVEDMASEQKARTTYDNILRLVNDLDACAAPCHMDRERLSFYQIPLVH